jgi:DNA-binding NarL/FixJ family response regulator
MANSISICIVEDLTDVRQGLESLLGNTPGFLWLQSFESAEEALAGIPGLQPDVVIMDINLAGMDGIRCIRELKPVCPATQFIMFTINEDSSQIFEALEAGASGYLVKTTPPSRIIEALQELHDGGAPMSTSIARKVVSAFQKKDPIANNPLSTRETEILGWLSKGFMYKEIAAKLNITTGTVRQHIHKIYEKLHVQNRTEAINKLYGNNQ